MTSDCAERQTAAVRRRFTHRLPSQIEIQATRVGCDIQLLLRGGSSPHIGCIVLATPRPSLTGDGSRRATASVINVTGHKDEALCRYLAEKVAAAADAVTVCTGGFEYRRDDAGTDSGSAGGCEAYGTGSEGVGGWKRRLMGERMKYTAIIADGWEVLIIWCEDFRAGIGFRKGLDAEWKNGIS